jgi:hypothetical protein
VARNDLCVADWDSDSHLSTQLSLPTGESGKARTRSKGCRADNDSQRRRRAAGSVWAVALAHESCCTQAGRQAAASMQAQL